MRSSSQARLPHYALRCPHLWWHHDCVLGRLWLLLPRGLHPLALPHCVPELLHPHRHVGSAVSARVAALAGHARSHGRGRERDGASPRQAGRPRRHEAGGAEYHGRHRSGRRAGQVQQQGAAHGRTIAEPAPHADWRGRAVWPADLRHQPHHVLCHVSV